jgi:maleylpyruvate isomerase
VTFNDLDLPDRLLIARRGTAYFAQHLAQLSDEALDADSLLPGWSRRHVLAHLGHNAAALCRLMDWATTGVETPMYESTEQRAREIDEGATLSAAGLRNLFDHSVARLEDKWRHAPASAWSAQVRTAQGRLVPASETAWMRTREVWIHAVDLGNGGRFGDFPLVVLESLLDDVVAMWRRKDVGGGLVLRVEDRNSVAVQPDSQPLGTVAGSLAAVTRWAVGRGASRVEISGDLDVPPRWL